MTTIERPDEAELRDRINDLRANLDHLVELGGYFDLKTTLTQNTEHPSDGPMRTVINKNFQSKSPWLVLEEPNDNVAKIAYVNKFYLVKQYVNLSGFSSAQAKPARYTVVTAEINAISSQRLQARPDLGVSSFALRNLELTPAPSVEDLSGNRQGLGALFIIHSLSKEIKARRLASRLRTCENLGQKLLAAAQDYKLNPALNGIKI